MVVSFLLSLVEMQPIREWGALELGHEVVKRLALGSELVFDFAVNFSKVL